MRNGKNLQERHLNEQQPWVEESSFCLELKFEALSCRHLFQAVACILTSSRPLQSVRDCPSRYQDLEGIPFFEQLRSIYLGLHVSS